MANSLDQLSNKLEMARAKVVELKTATKEPGDIGFINNINMQLEELSKKIVSTKDKIAKLGSSFDISKLETQLASTATATERLTATLDSLVSAEKLEHGSVTAIMADYQTMAKAIGNLEAAYRKLASAKDAADNKAVTPKGIAKSNAPDIDKLRDLHATAKSLRDEIAGLQADLAKGLNVNSLTTSIHEAQQELLRTLSSVDKLEGKLKLAPLVKGDTTTDRSKELELANRYRASVKDVTLSGGTVTPLDVTNMTSPERVKAYTAALGELNLQYAKLIEGEKKEAATDVDHAPKVKAQKAKKKAVEETTEAIKAQQAVESKPTGQFIPVSSIQTVSSTKDPDSLVAAAVEVKKSEDIVQQEAKETVKAIEQEIVAEEKLQAVRKKRGPNAGSFKPGPDSRRFNAPPPEFAGAYTAIRNLSEPLIPEIPAQEKSFADLNAQLKSQFGTQLPPATQLSPEFSNLSDKLKIIMSNPLSDRPQPLPKELQEIQAVVDNTVSAPPTKPPHTPVDPNLAQARLLKRAILKKLGDINGSRKDNALIDYLPADWFESIADPKNAPAPSWAQGPIPPIKPNLPVGIDPQDLISNGTPGLVPATPPRVNNDPKALSNNQDKYDKGVKAITEDLHKMGVEGAAAEKIIQNLSAALGRLTQVPEGLDITPKGDSIKINGFRTEGKPEGNENKINESFNKLTGLSATEEKNQLAALKREEAINKKQNEIFRAYIADRKKEIAEAKKVAREKEIAADKLAMQTAAYEDPNLKPVFSQAKTKGFDFTDLKSIEQQGSAGVRLLQFARDDFSRGYKVVEKFNTTVTRTGDVLPEVGRKFRDFGSSVARDITELTKWSIAMAVIYGPLQKLSEITSLAIENEVRLVSATIAVNDAFTSSEKIFGAAASAANDAGEEISTTLDAFTAAYRATGGGADEATRFATAQTLLADSMTLAKLAGIDETTAIDTLSAGLRQTGYGLDEGVKLLDKWVRTSQVANVDIATLATGFAVMGDTADAAGIKVDDLNALIATIAETGLASGKEAANAARRVVSSYQTAGAIAELNRLGIATEDANGKQRNFLDISEQIYELRSNKLISDPDFANLTLIVGQGVRGQATLSALLNDFKRVGEISGVSSSTQGGEAAKAMEMQLGTAQTAITRFNNTFLEFAQTMGTKGGVLDAFKLVTATGTGFVKVLDTIISGLGKATPLVIAMTAALVAFYRKPKETRDIYGQSAESFFFKAAMGVMGPDQRDPMQLRLQQQNPGYMMPTPNQDKANKFASYMITGGTSTLGKVGYGAGAGVLAGVVPATASAVGGDFKKAGLELGLAAVGGIVGNLAGGGPMGAMIGSTIGVSMAEVFIAIARPEIDRWKLGSNVGEVVIDTGTTDTNKNMTTTEARDKRMSELIALIESEGNGFEANINSALVNLILPAINREIAAGNAGGIDLLFENLRTMGITSEASKALGITPEEAKAKIGTGKGFDEVSASQYIFALSNNQAAKDEFKSLQTQQTQSGLNPNEKGAAQLQREEIKSQWGGLISDYVSSELKAVTASRGRGEIKSSDFNRITGQLTGFNTSSLSILASLKDNIDPSKIKELMDVMAYGSVEASGGIVTLANSIATLEEQIALTQDQTEKDGLIKSLETLRAALGSEINSQSLQVRLNRTPQAPIQGDLSSPFKSKDVDIIANITRALQRQYYKSGAGGSLSDASITLLESSFEKAAFPVKDAADLFYKVIAGLDPKFLAEAIKMAGEQGLLSEQSKNVSVDFQQYKDVDRGTLERLAAQSIQMNQTWKTKFGYTGEVGNQIAIAKDGVANPLKADFKILAMLLEKLVDQGQKQLDGMYNIPDGAYFWVNLAAAKMDRETRANGDNLTATDFATGDGSYIGGGNAVNVADLVSQTVKNATWADVKQNQTPWAVKNATWADVKKGQTPWALSADRSYDTIEGIRANRHDMSSTDPISKVPTVKNEITQHLNLNMTSTTTLMVDGRVLATVIKPFLASDLSKTTSAVTTSSAYYAI